MKTTLLVSIIAITTLLIVGCSKPETGASGAPEDSFPLLPTAQRADSFEAVATKLDLGGEAFLFMDVARAIQALSSSLSEMMGGLAQMSSSDPQVMMMAMIPYEELFEVMGVSNLGAFGLSSYREGDLFRDYWATIWHRSGPSPARTTPA